MQLTYNFNPAVAVAGMVAESRESNIVISKIASGAVPVGLLCAPGTDGEIGMQPTSADPNSTNPGQVIALPNGLAADPMVDASFVGIPIYDSSRAPYDTNNAYSDKDPVPVLRKGVIWVYSETAVTQYNPAYVRIAAGGGFVNGSWRDGAAGNFVKFPRGQWLTSRTTAGLAVLEVW